MSVVCGYGRTQVIPLLAVCVLFPCYRSWGTRPVSRALSTNLSSAGREGFGLIWVGHLSEGWWWFLKCYSPPLQRWKWYPEFAKANDFCIPLLWQWERQAGRFASARRFSAALPPALCSFFCPTLEVKVLGRVSWQIKGSYSPSTHSASRFGHPRRKPVNWTMTTKETEVVVALGGEAVGLGLVSRGKGGSVGPTAGSGTCGRWLRGTARFFSAWGENKRQRA